MVAVPCCKNNGDWRSKIKSQNAKVKKGPDICRRLGKVKIKKAKVKKGPDICRRFAEQAQ